MIQRLYFLRQELEVDCMTANVPVWVLFLYQCVCEIDHICLMWSGFAFAGLTMCLGLCQSLSEIISIYVVFHFSFYSISVSSLFYLPYSVFISAQLLEPFVKNIYLLQWNWNKARNDIKHIDRKTTMIQQPSCVGWSILQVLVCHVMFTIYALCGPKKVIVLSGHPEVSPKRNYLQSWRYSVSG